MSKYIDADRLRAEIERFSATEYGDNTFGDDIANGALDYVLEKIIPSLQQEQPVECIEEAAGEYASDSTGFIDMTAYNAFKSGAEWGAEQKTIELFRKQNCKNCGSQRCTGEGEWLEGCEKFREWKDKT